MTYKRTRNDQQQQAPGADGVLVQPLGMLSNISLSKRNVLREWRRANVAPIFIGGDGVVLNYRPASLTCRILERITRKHGIALDWHKLLQRKTTRIQMKKIFQDDSAGIP